MRRGAEKWAAWRGDLKDREASSSPRRRANRWPQPCSARRSWWEVWSRPRELREPGRVPSHARLCLEGAKLGPPVSGRSQAGEPSRASPGREEGAGCGQRRVPSDRQGALSRPVARAPHVLDVRTKLERRLIPSSTFKKPASGEVGKKPLMRSVRPPGRESPAPLDRTHCPGLRWSQ